MLKLPPKNIIYRDQFKMRLMSPNDGRAIFQAVQESRPDLKRFMFWSHFDSTLEKALGIYAEFHAKAMLGQHADFVGFDSKTDEFLFCASLVPESRLNRSALELGYWVSSKHKGQGLGTLAAQIMIVLAFEYYKADRLAIVCNPENSASLRIIEKCGFQKEGELRNHFGLPTEKMVAEGFSSQRKSYHFSLITEDLERLEWFDAVSKDLKIDSY